MSAPKTINTFAEFVATLEDGELAHDLQETVNEMAEKLSDHWTEHRGKPKGTITLTLDFEVLKGQFDIKAKVGKKFPVPPRGSTHLWCTSDNRFSGSNPKQRDLPFEVVGGDADTVEKVDPETGEFVTV